MRPFLLAVVPALALTAATAADPPSKRGGGFFGFGAPKGEQISADLFPNSGGPNATSQTAASPSGEIFRGGQPSRVDPVSYRIENGRRVELAPPASKPAQTAAPISPSASLIATEQVSDTTEKRRGGLLGFGRRNEDRESENTVVTPVPAAPPALAATPVAAPKPAPVATPLPPVATVPRQPAAPVQAAPVPDTPAFADADEAGRKEKSGWRPSFPSMPSLPSLLPWRKSDKNDPSPPAAAPANTIVAAPVAAETAVPSPANPPEAPRASTKPTDAKPEVATFEIRRDESQPLEPTKEKRSDREGGLLNPIAKITPPKKEIDLSSAETIIQDGEIVGDSGSNFQTSVPPSPSGPRQAPQVVDGVKTYSSWDDITARPSSVADRLINQIR